MVFFFLTNNITKKIFLLAIIITINSFTFNGTNTSNNKQYLNIFIQILFYMWAICHSYFSKCFK